MHACDGDDDEGESACLEEVGDGHAHNVAAAQHHRALAADCHTTALQQLQAPLTTPRTQPFNTPSPVSEYCKPLGLANRAYPFPCSLL